jgi:serine/threonine-protein kinase
MRRPPAAALVGSGALCYHATPWGKGRGDSIFKDFRKESLRKPLYVLLGLAGFAGVLVVVAALSAYMTVRRSVAGRTLEVPDLTGMTMEEAEAVLRKNGLVLEEAARRNDERVEAGRLLAQDPPAGSDIKLQRKVKVVVSLGDKVNSIPELRGGAARKAQITLQQLGMRLGDQVYVHTRRVAENLVIAQDPLPESAGLREGKVALLVSRGAPDRVFVMPDLTGRTEKEATAFLTRFGLRVGPVRGSSGAAAPPGTVVGQDPPPGYPVRGGDLIALTVAAGGGGG